jgi:hypothetical protein
MFMKVCSRIFVFSLVLSLAQAAPTKEANPFDGPPVSPASNPVDQRVFDKLAAQGIAPAHLCSDEVFLRRVYLDTIGTLPTVEEAKTFLADKNPAKRGSLIDQLLLRDEFADYWATKWSDLLRVKAEYPINLWPNAAQAYHHWIRASIQANKPYDQFVRELLTANGSNFSVGPVNFYRALQSRDATTVARTVALTFMGTRAEKWPAEQLGGMAAFFTKIGYKYTGEWKEEIVFFDPSKVAPPGLIPATFPDGSLAKISADRDPREVFAEWLVAPKNPWFARAAANRVWFWLLGRGIVQEPDDLRPDNPPSNPELLVVLEQELIAAHYDLKRLFRLILNSQTYQLSCIPRSDKPEAAAHFAFYSLRRLDAEVLIDALNQITGGSEKYTSAIPEPYTYIPEGVRSIALPDGSITSSFLEMFGRPARDTGQATERNNSPSASQRLQLLNSSNIQRKIEQGPKLQALLRENQKRPRELIDALYLSILSRYPTAEEREKISSYVKTGNITPRQAAVDVVWALINSAEFLHRH